MGTYATLVVPLEEPVETTVGVWIEGQTETMTVGVGEGGLAGAMSVGAGDDGWTRLACPQAMTSSIE